MFNFPERNIYLSLVVNSSNVPVSALRLRGHPCRNTRAAEDKKWVFRFRWGFRQRACKCEWRGVGYIWPWLASRRSCQKNRAIDRCISKKKINKNWKIARQGLKVGLIKSRKARKHPDRQINRYICRSPQVGFKRYGQKDKPTDTPTSCLSLFINGEDADAGALCPPYRDGRMKNKRADSCHPPSTDGLSECVGGSIKRRRGQTGRCYSGAEECIS